MDKDYASSYEFFVEFDLDGSSKHSTLSFAKISNLQSKIEYETIYEGGNNNPILLPIPSKQPETVTFERGILISGRKGDWDTIQPGMMVEHVVIHIEKNQGVVKNLEFDHGIVLLKEYPLLNALSNEIYVEKLQIAHSGLKENYEPYTLPFMNIFN